MASNVEEAPEKKNYMQNTQKGSSWSNDMKGHAQQCVEMCCEWENKSVSQKKQAATLCIDDHQLKKILKSLVNLLRFPRRSYSSVFIGLELVDLSQSGP